MDMGNVPRAVWRAAETRADVLRPLAALPVVPADRVRDAARALGVSERWTYILIDRLRAQGGELTALLPRPGRGAPRQARIAADREAITAAVIAAEYLTSQKVRPAQIVRSVQARCRQAGVVAPAESTIRRRLRHVDRSAMSRSRDTDPRTQPVCGETPRPDYPLDVVQIDHTRVDVILVDPIERYPIGRPWLTVAIDVLSRAIAGFHLSLEAPSATSVGLCLAHMATEKETWMAARGVTDVAWPLVGKPGTLGVDNAAEFHAEAFTRGCSQHGIAIDWRPPGQPWFGGTVERLIGTLMQRIHTLPGTTFSNTAQRDHYDSEAQACLTLEELERWLTVAICKDYHQSGHRGLEGATPMARLDSGLEALQRAGGHLAAPRDAHRYLIDFLPVLRRTLQRDGFTVDHIRYFSNALKPWIAARDARVEGPMVLRRDPRDLSRIYVLDPFDGSYLEVPYRTLSRHAITLWEHRAATKRARAIRSTQANEEMIFAAFAELQEIARTAKQTTKAARRNRARARARVARESPAVQPDTRRRDPPPKPDSAPPLPFLDFLHFRL